MVMRNLGMAASWQTNLIRAKHLINQMISTMLISIITVMHTPQKCLRWYCAGVAIRITTNAWQSINHMIRASVRIINWNLIKGLDKTILTKAMTNLGIKCKIRLLDLGTKSHQDMVRDLLVQIFHKKLNIFYRFWKMPAKTYKRGTSLSRNWKSSKWQTKTGKPLVRINHCKELYSMIFL